MSRRKCCCDCWSVEDNFNRDDSTDIGPVLIEKRGDSEIVGQKLWMPGGVSALVYTQDEHPKHAYSGIVYAQITTVEGGVYRLGINYDNTTDQGHWGQLKQKATSVEVSASVDGAQEFEGWNPGVTHELMLCYTGLDGGLLNFVWSDLFNVWGPAGPFTDGWRANLSNPGVENIEFDNFKFQEHFITNIKCPLCGCSCDHYSPPQDKVTLTFYGTGCMSEIDGLSVALTIENDEDLAPFPSYTGTTGICEAGHTWDFSIGCSGMNPMDWNLEFQITVPPGGGSTIGEAESPQSPVSASCDPLVLTYPVTSACEDPGFCVYSPCCQEPLGTGEWWMVVTE